MDALVKNAVLELTVEGYSSEGFGVARYNGMVVFVPCAARGDLLSVRIVKVLKNHAFGRIEKIITPSEARREPQCPLFPKCGGCDFLHISYEEELRLKEERVFEALTRIGGFDVSFPSAVPSPNILRSRNKAIFPLQGTPVGTVFGFYRSRSHDVVPCRDCLINDEKASALAAAVAKWADTFGVSVYDEYNHTGILRKVFTRCGDGGVLLCIAAAADKLPHVKELTEFCISACPELCGIVLNVNDKETNLALSDKCVTLWGKPYLEDRLSGNLFRLSPLSFYQVNRAQAENLYDCVLSYASPGRDADALDLYCGVGTITLALARGFRSVVGAEIVPRAIDDARENARLNGVPNAEFICADAGDAAESMKARGFSPNTVVCDPPRKGMDKKALDAVLSFGAERIVYVACDPASLARDAKYLCENGYTLSEYKVFDMFPCTANVETVCLLSRQKKDFISALDEPKDAGYMRIK